MRKKVRGGRGKGKGGDRGKRWEGRFRG